MSPVQEGCKVENEVVRTQEVKLQEVFEPEDVLEPGHVLEPEKAVKLLAAVVDQQYLKLEGWLVCRRSYQV